MNSYVDDSITRKTVTIEQEGKNNNNKKMNTYTDNSFTTRTPITEQEGKNSNDHIIIDIKNMR